MLNKQQILEANDRGQEVVDVPQWGGQVIVREMSAAERIQFELMAGEDEQKIRALLIVFCAVDENGRRLFEIGDVDALAKKSWRTVRKVSDVALRLNAAQQSALEGARENFSPAR